MRSRFSYLLFLKMGQERTGPAKLKREVSLIDAETWIGIGVVANQPFDLDVWCHY